MDLINKKLKQSSFKKYCIPGIILIAIPVVYFIVFPDNVFVQPEEIIGDCLITIFVIVMLIFGILLQIEIRYLTPLH